MNELDFQTTNLILTGYLIYLPVALILTGIVAHYLFRTGKYFMQDIFPNRPEVATATNELFKIGFYLFNIGYAFVNLEIATYRFRNDYQGLVEALSTKIGWFSIYLGIFLFINLFLFFRGRRIATRKNNLPSKVNS